MDKTMTKAPLNFFYNSNDDWQNTYNNQGFFLHNVERLRWCLVEADFLENNPFAGCVDIWTLNVKDPLAFYRLAMTSYQDLVKMVEQNDWDWTGDDFDHMDAYLSWIQDHDKTFCYSSQIINECEYLEIHAWHIPKEFAEGNLRKAYLQGIEDGRIEA